jgi:uncharacterized protein
MSEAIRILSIDGGGIRGIIPAMVVQALLGDDTKAQDVFHIIAGTSTGGIIACGLAKPNPLNIQDIIDLYVQHGGEIFKKRPLEWVHYLRWPRYKPTALDRFLSEKLGNTLLSDVKNVELLVPSYAIHLAKQNPPGNNCAPMFFRSWQANGRLIGHADKSEYDFPLKSVARATSAAPTYFPPAVIANRAGQSFTMVDGGVFANNPTMCAIVEAYHLYHSKNVMVVSIGTGTEPTRVNASAAASWGDLSWALPMMSIFMASSSQTVAFEAGELLGKSHVRFDISLTKRTPQGRMVDPDMDDASPANITALVDEAKELIAEQRHVLDRLAEQLGEKKPELELKTTLPPPGFL